MSPISKRRWSSSSVETNIQTQARVQTMFQALMGKIHQRSTLVRKVNPTLISTCRSFPRPNTRRNPRSKKYHNSFRASSPPQTKRPRSLTLYQACQHRSQYQPCKSSRRWIQTTRRQLPRPSLQSRRQRMTILANFTLVTWQESLSCKK